MTRCPACSFENDELRATCGACGAELGASALSRSAVADMYPAPASAQEQEILRLLREQKKITAIKVHRQATGLGLKESKEAVEALARRHGLTNAAPTGTGSLILGLGVVLLAIAAVMLFL